MAGRELWFSLSKAKGDFVVEPIFCRGHGGQNVNKVQDGCRITHPASKTVSECCEERSFIQNKKKAFEKLVKKESFQKWYKLECARRRGVLIDIEKKVEEDMLPQKLKVEVRKDGKWTNIEEV